MVTKLKSELQAIKCTSESFKFYTYKYRKLRPKFVQIFSYHTHMKYLVNKSSQYWLCVNNSPVMENVALNC